MKATLFEYCVNVKRKLGIPVVGLFIQVLEKIKDKNVNPLRVLCILSNLIQCELKEKDFRCRECVQALLDENFRWPESCPWDSDHGWDDILKSIEENLEQRQLIQVFCGVIQTTNRLENVPDPHGFDPYAVTSLQAELLMGLLDFRSDAFVRI